jgi:misacylated tRNA(Ala) deacylase
MSELLFRDDAYLKTATAQVVAVSERGIELDRTIFYPLGGGQPGDTGVLVRANGDRIAIASCWRSTGSGVMRSCGSTLRCT